ncbi:MAG: hypothetical protein SGBAC_002439 [Bacillariaceae sp.]
MVLTTQVQSRKQRRKENRKRKRKLGKNHVAVEEQDEDISAAKEQVVATKKKKNDYDKESKKKKQSKADDRYAEMDPSLAAALRRDEEEIADLEAKLGVSKSKSGKAKLNKEYAKLEGYGDGFGDFLDDLDNLVYRINNRTSDGEEESEEDIVSKNEKGKKGKRKEPESNDRYGKFEPDIAAAMKRDDDEIEDLARKLGFKKKKDKKKLYTEYAKLEGFGDDFGDFLDGLDDVVERVTTSNEDADLYVKGGASKRARTHRDSDDESSDEEEIVPMKDLDDESSNEEEIVEMKDPYEQLDEDDSVLDELEATKAQESEEYSEGSDQYESEKEESGDNDDDGEKSMSEDDQQSHQSSVSEDSENTGEEPDHDVADTYTATVGEDIYGNKVDGCSSASAKPKKYVPPHLRKAHEDDKDEEEKLFLIRRSLNNAMNRLSEDTLISVAQQAAKIYSGHPTQLVLKMMWKNTKDACVSAPMLMKGLIPVYIACIVGTHIQTGDTVQIGEYLLEMVVTDLCASLKLFRSKAAEGGAEDDSTDLEKKQICNLMLLLCYLYNYGVIHCSFMYDIVRLLIENFSEADIECLLLLLCHCGRSLRSDDPLALKEIVLLVQKKKKSNESLASSSRAEYMISAIMDLKNNRRSKQDEVFAEKSGKLRRLLGRIKSSSASKKKADSSLRITLQDILGAETKGRWWKVGASWVGNQYRFDDGNSSKQNESGKKSESSSNKSEEDEALLQLAAKYRMNTDRKRSIFCIIMSGADCDDTFEKLCRSSMLQNRSERDTVRVLLACCEGEKSYNRFYGHLANRICEYQPQCKFSFQLAFWDAFKQFKGMGARKAANLAKLLFHLVVTHQALRLMPVVKAIEIDEDMEEAALIFLTILLTDVLEYYDDPALVKSLFAGGGGKNVSEEQAEQEEGFRASMLVFLLETLKNSPNNKKGSKFKKNFKAVVKTLDTDGFGSML